MKNIGGAVSAFVMVLAISACSDSEDVSLEELSAEEIYARGEAALEDRPGEAAEIFEELERIYPYSPLTRIAMIRAGEAYYQAGEYDGAILAGQRFLQFFPGDDNAARAQFIVALSNYDQIPDVKRDQTFSRNAHRELRFLAQRYPDSGYAGDALLMLDAAEDQLAGKEIDIGRFYLRHGHYLAAINRFRRVIDEYPKTSHVAEALHRLVEANLALGLESEARRAAAILGYNFQGSEWYADSFALLERADADGSARDSGSWFDRLFGRT